jgi:hypothetical protein
MGSKEVAGDQRDRWLKRSSRERERKRDDLCRNRGRVLSLASAAIINRTRHVLETHSLKSRRIIYLRQIEIAWKLCQCRLAQRDVHANEV